MRTDARGGGEVVWLAMLRFAASLTIWIPVHALLCGCGGSPHAKIPSDTRPTSPAIAKTGAPAALVDGVAIDGATLAASALEAAGAVTFEEAALDALIAKELASEGLSVPDEATNAERLRLFARIAEEAGVNEEQAGTLVDRFRAVRGLGPRRFDAMLRRNAALRLLVARAGLIDGAAVAALSEAELGPRATARLIVTRTAAEASRLRAEIETAPAADRAAKFSQAAFTHSIDPSSARGGLFGPVSHADVTVPAPLRSSLALPAGELSPVISIEQGFALLLIESQVAAAARTDAAVEAARAKATARVEREAMDALAARLLAEARITVMDEHLRWAWERRPR